jgi:hypothetical protein
VNSATDSPTTARNSRWKWKLENEAALAISIIDGLLGRFAQIKSIARQIRR